MTRNPRWILLPEWWGCTYPPDPSTTSPDSAPQHHELF